MSQCQPPLLVETTSSITTSITTTLSPSFTREDWHDIQLAHNYRLSLSHPSQSSFRVVALLFFEWIQPKDEEDPLESNHHQHQHYQQQQQRRRRPPPPIVLFPMGQTTLDGRMYVVGTNDEPGYMGGSICAERAGLVQLRFAPPHRLTKLVLATDSVQPIAPGMLCREFLAGHPYQVPWSLPVLSSACCCSRCHLQDEALYHNPVGNHRELAMSSCLGRMPSTDPLLISCKEGDEEDDDKLLPQQQPQPQPHDIPMLVTTIQELYPYPSPFTRRTARESVLMGECYNALDRSRDDLHQLDETAKRLLELAILEARSTFAKTTDSHTITISNNNANNNDMHTRKNGIIMDDANHDDATIITTTTTTPAVPPPPKQSTDSSIHPIHFGAAVLFDDGTICTSHQTSALEYGCTLDAVSQLVSYIQESTAPPTLLVQADQYGIAHAPFAPARSFLTEHGHEQCLILLHYDAHHHRHHHRPKGDGREEMNWDKKEVYHDDNHTKNDLIASIQQWELIQIPAAELAPYTPSWTLSTDRTKLM